MAAVWIVPGGRGRMARSTPQPSVRDHERPPSVIYHSTTDWTDAYTNDRYVADSAAIPAAWMHSAQGYRDTMLAAGQAQLDLPYGPHPRNRMDMFLPKGTPHGLMVLVHGGYWMELDQRWLSHLAHGAVQRGFAVAMPTYALCPEVRITAIGQQIGAAITAAAGMIGGPVCLTGHSAGGHLVTRMIAAGSPLPPEVLARIRTTLSLSGLHDLRPLMRTAMNETLRIDEAEALRESPALLRPVAGAGRLCAWVGGNERSEFIRQSALLANIWAGLGAETGFHAAPDRHHFNVMDGLADPDHPLTTTLLEG